MAGWLAAENKQLSPPSPRTRNVFCSLQVTRTRARPPFSPNISFLEAPELECVPQCLRMLYVAYTAWSQAAHELVQNPERPSLVVEVQTHRTA